MNSLEVSRITSTVHDNNVWESVLFAVMMKAQYKINDGELNPAYCMAWVWEKCIDIMNAKKAGVSYIKQKEILKR